MRIITMRRITGWIIGGLVTMALWVPGAGAQSFRQMPQNIQHNWRDIHQDRENLRHDWRDIHQDRENLRHDRSHLQRDRADRWHDWAYRHADRRAFWRNWYSVRPYHHHE